MKPLASPRPLPPTRSARPTESSPRSCIRISIPATSRPRTSSRRSPAPTISCPIRRSAGAIDAGEIDASGAEKAPPHARYYRDYAQEGGHPYGGQDAYGDFSQGDDLFAELLRRSAEQARRRPGADLHYELPIDFLDAVNGAGKTITLPQGGTLNVTIPAGVEDGHTLRLRGKGAPSPGEGPPGDALVQIVVRPHRYFTREGADILLDLPVTVKEAALGAEVRTPTTTGSVMLKIPKRSNTGDVLRLRARA